jgi:hypothetical protein
MLQKNLVSVKFVTVLNIPINQGQLARPKLYSSIVFPLFSFWGWSNAMVLSF